MKTNKAIFLMVALALTAIVAFAAAGNRSAYAALGGKIAQGRYAAAAPVIDGEKDAVWTIAARPLVTEEHNYGTAWGDIYVMFDDTALYFLAEVHDDGVYMPDCVNFFISEQNTNRVNKSNGINTYKQFAAGLIYSIMSNKQPQDGSARSAYIYE